MLSSHALPNLVDTAEGCFKMSRMIFCYQKRFPWTPFQNYKSAKRFPLEHRIVWPGLSHVKQCQKTMQNASFGYQCVIIVILNPLGTKILTIKLLKPLNHFPLSFSVVTLHPNLRIQFHQSITVTKKNNQASGKLKNIMIFFSLS